MPSLGAPEIIVLVVVIAVVFGWKKLPDAARSLGRSMRILKSEVGEMKNDGKTDEAHNQSGADEAAQTVKELPAAEQPVVDPTGTNPQASDATKQSRN